MASLLKHLFLDDEIIRAFVSKHHAACEIAVRIYSDRHPDSIEQLKYSLLSFIIQGNSEYVESKYGLSEFLNLRLSDIDGRLPNFTVKEVIEAVRNKAHHPNDLNWKKSIRIIAALEKADPRLEIIQIISDCIIACFSPLYFDFLVQDGNSELVSFHAFAIGSLGTTELSVSEYAQSDSLPTTFFDKGRTFIWIIRFDKIEQNVTVPTLVSLKFFGSNAPEIFITVNSDTGQLQLRIHNNKFKWLIETKNEYKGWLSIQLSMQVVQNSLQIDMQIDKEELSATVDIKNPLEESKHRITIGATDRLMSGAKLGVATNLQMLGFKNNKTEVIFEHFTKVAREIEYRRSQS